MSGADQSGDRASIEPGASKAHGKVILLGEHAVVYGVPAIAVGIERGVRGRARAIEGPTSRLRVREWNVEIGEDEDRDLSRALKAVLAASRASTSVEVDLEVELPPGGGLGCSAAMGVACARAIDPRASDDEIATRVAAWESVFHGNPSGVDAAVSTTGGCLLFEKVLGFQPVRVGADLHLCIGHTGVPSSTRSMVEAVAKQRERRPEVVAKTFEGITSLVRNAKLAIEAGDRFALGRLMDLNQMLLGGLFVSTTEIETMCGLARDAGAFGAKLTGAGGGGCVVALVAGDSGANKVLEAWRAAGFDSFATRVAASPIERIIASFEKAERAS
jgi:mevalonate kinase